MQSTDSTLIVVETLRKASSQNYNDLKPAEQQLKAWENQPGFYLTLMNIFNNRELETNTRWLSVLYLKNGIDRYWRKHAVNGISEEEKSSIKQLLLNNFSEQINQLAIQLAVIIGKVARIDCPKDWPVLIPSLVEALMSNDLDLLAKQRVLLTFHQVIKTLASRRLAHDRRLFEELTGNVFTLVYKIWQQQNSILINNITTNQTSEVCMVSLEYTRLSLKVLRRQVVYGFKNPHEHIEVTEFIQACFTSIQQLIEHDDRIGTIGLYEDIYKLQLLYSKILRDMLLYHSEFYINFIQTSLTMVLMLCFSEDVRLKSERFQVNILNLMKDIINHDDYVAQNLNNQLAGGEVNNMAMRADTEKKKVLNEQSLPQILHTMIRRHMLLRQSDLELWENDPEDLVNEEVGDSWKYSLRACVETLYVTLFQNYKELLVPNLLQLVSESQQSLPSADDLSAVLTRDALYNAVGLAAYEIKDEVNFDNWLQSHLITELQVNHPQYRIIRRRIIWLIRNWVGVKMSTAIRPTVYQLVTSFLSESQDLVVRVEAALALKACIDDYEFTAEQFSPYLPSAFHQLYTLLVFVDSCDTKMQLLHVMSFLIEREGSAILPHVGILAEHLPLLWESAGEHDLLRSAIVSTLQPLVDSLGKNSTQIYQIALPVIRLAVNLEEKAHIYLLEDGLELWEMILYNATSLTPDLLQLFSAIPPLLETSTENLRVLIKIMEAYVLLSAEQIIQTYGQILQQSLISLVSDIKYQGLILVLKLIEVMFIVQSRQSAVMYREMFVKRVIPNLLSNEDYPMVVSLYLCIISRLVLEDPSLFFSYISEFSISTNNQETDVISELMHVWFEKLDCVSQPERRKVCALAISSLLPSPLSHNVKRLDYMVNSCVQVLHDVCDPISEDDQQRVDTLVLRSNDTESSDDEMDTEHMRRKHQLSHKDPVFHLQLDKYVFEKLNQLQTQLGVEKFNENMSCIDVDILSQLQTFQPKQT